MATNTFSFSEKWSRTIQLVFSIRDVYRAVAKFIEEEGIMTEGDTYHKQSITDPVVKTIGTDGAITRQAITLSDDTLDIDQKKEITFNLPLTEELQDHFKIAAVYAKRAAILLSNKLDADHMAEYDNATDTIDDGDFGGTVGNGVTISPTNCYKAFTIADRKQSALNLPEGNRWCIISYQFREKFMEYLSNRDTALGDSTGKNGHIGKWMGRDIYISNNLGWSARLEFGTNPSNTNTVVINGVTFTWLSTLGSTAGNIHITSSAAISADIFVAAINAPGTTVAEDTDTGFVALSTANQNLLSKITATDGTTYITLKGVGSSAVVVSETLAAAADIWTTTLQEQHCIFGQGKPVSMVVQKFPSFRKQQRSGYISLDYITWMLYGVKTFADGATQMLDLQMRSDSF